MNNKIKIGERVIGSTGGGRYGTRQVIGEYAGQADDNIYLIKVTRTLFKQPCVTYERCYNVKRVK